MSEDDVLWNASVVLAYLARQAGSCAEPHWLWPFHEAPPELRALSCNGGDEDWILVLPVGASRPMWSEEGGSFGCCSVEQHELPCGRTVLIGCHS